MSEIKNEKFVLTDAQWREKLSPEQYKIARKHGTERAFTSSFNENKQTGIYKCVGCEAELFASDTKFDSGTGWPSYFAPISETAVSEHTDGSFFMKRTEIRCATCDSHLGHVFPDGPAPSGLRYCMNGAVMDFEADDS
jgi:peptide-methionine (R)-S-oxide reductase